MCKNEEDDSLFFQEIDQEAADESFRLYNEALEAYDDLPRARELLEKSITVREHAKTYERLFDILMSMGKRDEALVALKKAYALNPKHNHIASFYAQELINDGDVLKAKQILEDILARSSTYGPAKRLLEKINSK